MDPTEKFDLAIPDYEAALALKTELLPLSSRQLAEAHYKLSIVLDLTSGRLSQAIRHAELALDSVEARLAEMRNAQSGQMPPISESAKPVSKGKGKQKAPSSILSPEELVQNMTKSQIEAEMKDLEGLREDLALKVCKIPVLQFYETYRLTLFDILGGRTEDKPRRGRGND